MSYKHSRAPRPPQPSHSAPCRPSIAWDGSTPGLDPEDAERLAEQLDAVVFGHERFELLAAESVALAAIGIESAARTAMLAVRNLQSCCPPLPDREVRLLALWAVPT